MLLFARPPCVEGRRVAPDTLQRVSGEFDDIAAVGAQPLDEPLEVRVGVRVEQLGAGLPNR